MDRPYNCLLARHTETDWNVQDRYSGQSHKPVLTPRGEEQAHELGRALQDTGVTHIISSMLRRSIQTAHIIWRELGGLDFSNVFPSSDERLNELSVGQMDGITKVEARERFTDPRFSTRHPDYDFRPIGGECREEVIRRHHDAAQQYLRWGIPLFVGHGTALRTFLESCGVSESIEQGGFVRLLYRRLPDEIRTPSVTVR